MVWKLDRLGRSLQHLIEIVTSLDERNVQLQSLTQGINTRTASGRMIFGLIASIGDVVELVELLCLAILSTPREGGKN